MGATQVKCLPVYIVLDTSSSMKKHEQLLNDSIERLYDELVTSPRVSDFVQLSIISFNTKAEVVLPMKRAVRVHGVVREKGSQKPVAGVRVAVAIAETGAMTTGDDGSYEGFMAPGSTSVTPRAVYRGFFE